MAEGLQYLTQEARRSHERCMAVAHRERELAATARGSKASEGWHRGWAMHALARAAATRLQLSRHLAGAY